MTTISHRGEESEQNEETELLRDIRACVTQLFKASSLIRQAAPVDLFAKALSRHRYHFNDQFDIAHVGEKYPKLAIDEFSWLRKRLGRAITQRRHYLCYIQDHREKLGSVNAEAEQAKLTAPTLQAPAEALLLLDTQHDSSSRPSTFLTKASTLMPGHITSQLLSVVEKSDSEADTQSYTTISRSVGGDMDSSAITRIPKLENLQFRSSKELECPFCYRIKKFKNEREWRRHVFSDLRSYVCTFPGCDAPYFGDVNEWFHHEMQNHRVSYNCQFCQSASFQHRERYLAHVQSHHPKLLEKSDEQLVCDIARKPVDKIYPQDCPCCSDWLDRLRDRVETSNVPSTSSNTVICVDLPVFKRHLASHLEQLALFAAPIPSTNNDNDISSDAAVGGNQDALSERLNISTPSWAAFEAMAFDSTRRDAVPKEERPTTPSWADFLVSELESEKDVLNRLSSFFPDEQSSRDPYTDSEISEISLLLKRSHRRWSKVPRTYTVLRAIGCLDSIDELIDAGFSDYQFPVTLRTMWDRLSGRIPAKLIEDQGLILTRRNDLDLERGESGQHCYFKEGERLPLESTATALGANGMFVDKVISSISNREYARKRLARDGVYWPRVQGIITEIRVLKHLKHHHIVRFIGSYTDPDYIAVITQPFVDMNLLDYLGLVTTSDYKTLRSFIGCLATGLEFLHKQGVIHGGINPRNILIHDGRILFANFDMAHDVSDTDGSTTTPVVQFFANHGAPEAAELKPINKMADIWSLGVVYVELVTILKGKDLEYMNKFFANHGSQLPSIRQNPEAFSEFVSELISLGELSDNRILDWALLMLSADHQLRPTASWLVSGIVVTENVEDKKGFCGECCLYPSRDFFDYAES